MKAEKICEKYLESLNQGNLKNLLALFDKGAVVISPLYGKMPATKFYTDLFSDTNRSETQLLNIFTSDSRDNNVALHFHYSWTLKNDKVVAFECIDLIEINPETGKISRLKIIYDTFLLREDFNKNRSEKH